MSVMAETSQSAMGPYVAVAAVGLVLNAWTAVRREALVVKVPGGEGGGDGGDGGEGGDDGGDGGGGGDEGGEGGNGGWNCTTKDLVSLHGTNRPKKRSVQSRAPTTPPRSSRPNPS